MSDQSQGEACPLPAGREDPDANAVSRMLDAKRIAVVGLSDDPSRPSYDVSHYLQRHGYEIVPVNPSVSAVLGQKSYADLASVPGAVDVVLVFRRAEFAAAIAEAAAGKKAMGVWLQAGIRSEEAKRIAAAAGMEFVQDRCMMVEHHARRAEHNTRDKKRSENGCGNQL